MKTAGLVLLNLGVTVVVVAAAQLLLSPPPAAPVEPSRPAAAAPDLSGRVGRLEARMDELGASLDALRKEVAESHAAAKDQAEKDRLETASAMTKILESAKTIEGGRKPETDAFANQISKVMKQGIRQEFKRMSDLITAPTPEGLEQRKRQLKMFAGMMGAGAGLDQAQIATFEKILGEADDRAMEELRPILQGVEDYKQVDYSKVRKITTDSFASQNERIDQEFPKDKADRVKQQLDPIRSMFGATIDALEKESTAPAEAPK